MRTLSEIFTLILFSFSILILFISCEGEAGKPGVNLLGSDLQPPVVEIIFPLADRSVYNNVVIELNVTDDDSADRVEFLLDGILTDLEQFVPFGLPWQYSWNCSELTLGRHSLQAIAYDRSDRRGVSPLLYLHKADPATAPSSDTLSYFSGSDEGDVSWTLPDYRENRFTGYGVRFTVGGLCTIYYIRIRVLRDAEWGVMVPLVDVTTSIEGSPGELIARKPLILRELLEEFDGWQEIDLRRNIVQMSGEFFVLVTMPEELVGDTDTLGFWSDPGVWHNKHSYVQEDGQWRVYMDSPTMTPNFLIEAIVRY